jgi:hypothetical protein
MFKKSKIKLRKPLCCSFLNEELFWDHLFKLDVLTPGDAGRVVVLHQLVQAVELHHPQEELALCVPQHLQQHENFTFLVSGLMYGTLSI